MNLNMYFQMFYRVTSFLVESTKYMFTCVKNTDGIESHLNLISIIHFKNHILFELKDINISKILFPCKFVFLFDLCRLIIMTATLQIRICSIY